MTKKGEQNSTWPYLIATLVLLSIFIGYLYVHQAPQETANKKIETTIAVDTVKQDQPVQPEPEVPIVKSVQYFLDRDHKTKAPEPVFAVSQPLFLQLKLSGFKKSAGNVSGTVDLKITNSQGTVIATKPKFAAFTQGYNKDNNIVVNGQIKITEPEIYLLQFKISDYFSKQEITHSEKVVVSLVKSPP